MFLWMWCRQQDSQGAFLRGTVRPQVSALAASGGLQPGQGGHSGAVGSDFSAPSSDPGTVLLRPGDLPPLRF